MTTVTLSQLSTWDPAPFRQAATATEANSQRIARAEEAFARALFAATKWEGRARHAAGLKTDEELRHARRVRGLLAELTDVLQLAAREFDETRTLIRVKSADAQAAGGTVHDDGRVTNVADPGQASLLQQQIQGALVRASLADSTAAKRLGEIGELLARPSG